MPRSTESLKITKEDLYGQLKAMGMKPSGIDSNGKATIASEAEIFKFNYIHDGEDYGTGRMSLTTTRGKPTVLMDYSRDLTKAPGWSKFISRMSRWVTDRGLSWEPSDEDNSDLDYDLAKRKHMERMNESYHAMGRMKSYNDAIPETKIIIQHNKVMEDGEQRFRYVEKIFIENALGERILAPTTKPGIAKVYARHIAEGGLPHDERWKHISGLCEEYTKMAGFVRATRSNQFNESAQQLVNEGINHYFNLRETLNKMIGKKGYNSYFESWTPTLTEDEEATDLSEMFMTSSLDPRIESVMPILGKLSKNISETKMKEVDELAEWADSLIEQESITSNNPQGIPESELDEVDMGQYDAVKSSPKGEPDGEVFKKFREKVRQYGDELEKRQKEKEQGVAEGNKENKQKKNDYVASIIQKKLHPSVLPSLEYGRRELKKQDVEEGELTPVPSGHKGLNKQQKAAGQLDADDKVQPTGPILGAEPKSQKGLRGKLVGASESVDPLERIKKLTK